MPRNFHGKDRRHNKLLSDDSATQPLSGWNQSPGRNKQKWVKADADNIFPRLGQYLVSDPTTDPFSHQRQPAGPTRSFQSYRRDHMYDQACAEPSNCHQKEKRTGLFQPNTQTLLLSSREFKEYLLHAVEEGKRRMDEWIISEFEQSSSPERNIIIWETCTMDWQPERTVVIPHAVEIRYPWDVVEDAGKERSKRKKGGRDEIMEGIS